MMKWAVVSASHWSLPATAYAISMILKHIIFHLIGISKADLLHHTTNRHFDYLDCMMITAWINGAVRVLNHMYVISPWYSCIILVTSLAGMKFSWFLCRACDVVPAVNVTSQTLIPFICTLYLIRALPIIKLDASLTLKVAVYLKLRISLTPKKKTIIVRF